MYFTILIWVICFGDIAYGVTVTFEPNKAALSDSVTITCKRSTGSSASITWELDSSPLTSCDGASNDVCIPYPAGYRFSTDVSVNEFNLSLASSSIIECKTYTCTDATTTADTVSENISFGYWDKTEVTSTEPGANKIGSISITTGCVLSPDDLTITWSKIVNDISVALSADDQSPVTSADKSTCTRTCHTEEDKKVTSGFTHTEYTGTDAVTVQYMVTVSHSSYPDNADIYNWTSAIYTLKQGNTGGLSTGAKAGIASAVVVVVVGIGATIAVVKLKKMGKLPCNNDSSTNAVSTGSSPKNAGTKLLEKKKYDDQAHLNLLGNEEKRPGRPQPPPPAGANPSSQLPNIHTTGHDSKGRGLSGKFGDDDHPLVGFDILTQKAGALPTITDTPRENKKKTKKKKKDKQKDNQTTETAIDF